MMAVEGEQAAVEENRKIDQFFQKADLVVFDAQYTQSEYDNGKIGWGHSSMAHAISSAKRANAKRLALFHHDPERTDGRLDALTEQYCRTDDDGGPERFFAKEGMEIIL